MAKKKRRSKDRIRGKARSGASERRRKKKGRGRRSSGGGFKYKKRSKESWKKRAEQSGYNRRSMLEIDVKNFRPKDDDNVIRFLPPTWDDAEHYGHEVYVHYGIGPNGDAFLCPQEMLDEPCPVCQERQRAMKDNDKEYGDKLSAKKRVLVYLIDRDDDNAELQTWFMPWTLDADVTTLAIDKRTGEVLDVDNPDDGYDVEFVKTGKAAKTKYGGIAIARKSSPLDADEALEKAQENPLPDILKFYEYEEMEKALTAGGSAYDDEDEEEDEDEDEGKKGRKKKSKSKKKKGRRKYDDDEDEDEEEDEDEDEGDEDEDEDEGDEEDEGPELPTWKEVQEMDVEELEEVVEDHELDVETDIDEDDEEELDDLRLEVCDALGLEKPKKRRPKKSEKKKLRRRGRR